MVGMDRKDYRIAQTIAHPNLDAYSAPHGEICRSPRIPESSENIYGKPTEVKI